MSLPPHVQRAQPAGRAGIRSYWAAPRCLSSAVTLSSSSARCSTWHLFPTRPMRVQSDAGFPLSQKRGSAGAAASPSASAREASAAAEEDGQEDGQVDGQADVAPRRIRLGFIGAGQMAEAVARGLSTAGVVSLADMSAADVSSDRLAVFSDLGIAAKGCSGEVADSSDVIFIAVKPFAVQSVLSDLRASNRLSDRHLIVSIAAGVTLEQMQSWAGADMRVVRVMPNTPCLVGASAAAMSLGARATPADACLVREMFSAVGEVYEVEERLLDAVTGLSGSGPAYVFVAIEALADGGTAAGLPRKVALSLAAQTVYGAAKMVIETQKHPGQLKDSVASPAGTTIAGLHELEKGGFRSLLMNAVIAAANRSKEMSK